MADRIGPDPQRPTLLRAALICLSDGCPPEAGMQLCQLQEDDEDGECCKRCWERYLLWIDGGRRFDPYRRDRLYPGGLIG